MDPTKTRIVQIHPTRRCHLRCPHCYPSSGPEELGELPLALLCSAVDDARALGFDAIEVSGGEPLLYSGLEELLAHARALGLRTWLTTDGGLLSPPQVARLSGLVDFLALSLCGAPASHGGAFSAMAANLERLRRAELPFGFTFTLTRSNLQELAWVAEFALQRGARLLRILPLEESGRGGPQMRGEAPCPRTAARAELEARRLQAAAAERLTVHLDLVARDALVREPAQVYADEPPFIDAGALATATSLPSPLVVEPDGWVVPLQYGFGRSYALGDLAGSSLHDLAQRWLERRHRAFRALCRRVHRDAVRREAPPLLDWRAAMSRASRAEWPLGDA